jgi:zinc D-Ala-D-Ala carboxypeptidase
MRAHLRTFASELGISLASVEARGLPLCEEASELELVEVGEDGKEHFLVPAAANAWRSLQGAAIADDIQLFIVSAFRSVERQAELVRRKLAVGMPIDDVLSVCAPPGFSEHHTGRAVDLSTPGVSVLEAEFDQTVAFAWLTRRAKDFGFHLSFPAGNSQGYLYEPWHWCFHDVHAGGPPP